MRCSGHHSELLSSNLFVLSSGGSEDGEEVLLAGAVPLAEERVLPECPADVEINLQDLHRLPPLQPAAVIPDISPLYSHGKY